MKILNTLLKLSAGLLLSTSVAVANMSISNMLFFGDSLTDMGNDDKAPYSNSPGILWPHSVTEHYGLPLSKSGKQGEFGGNNWAVAGYTTKQMISEIETYLAASPVIDENDVAFLWIGSNDIIDNIMDNKLNPMPTEQLVQNMITNVNTSVTLLQQAGMKNIVIINLFALDITPAARLLSDKMVARIQEAVIKFNDQLLQLSQDTGIHHYDANAQLNVVLENHDAYGLKNITNQLKLCRRNCNADEYLFWDAVHPTNAAHKILAGFIISFIEQELGALPEKMDTAA